MIYATVYVSYHGSLAPEGTCVHVMIDGTVTPCSIDYTWWSPSLVKAHDTLTLHMTDESN